MQKQATLPHGNIRSIFVIILSIAFLVSLISFAHAQEEGAASSQEAQEEQPSVQQGSPDQGVEPVPVEEGVSEAAPEETIELPEEVREELERAAEEVAVPEDVREAINADVEVTNEDLNISTPKILPDNPLYVFKKLGRGIKKAFIFDPTKKAELELQYADATLVEAQELVEKKGEDAAPIVEKALEQYEETLQDVANRAEDLREAGDDVQEKFLEKLADRQIKQQKVLEKLEEKLPEQSLEKVTEARERSLEHAAEIFSKVVENKEQLGETFANALESQKGSEFKDFKNLEIMSAFEEKLPPEMRAGLEGAKKGALERMQQNFAQLPEEARKEKLEKYVEFVPGHAGRQLELIDTFKTTLAPTNIAPEFLNQLGVLKETAFKRFEDNLNQFTDSAKREELFRPFKEGAAEDLRLLSQLKDRSGGSNVPEKVKEEIEQAHQESFTKFREKFSNDSKALETAAQAEGFFKKFRENPDAVDFKVLDELRASLTPEQQEFVQNLESEAGKKMAEHFETGDPRFEDFFADPTDPQSIKVLEDLRSRLPIEAREGIARAIEVQREKFRGHVEQLDNPLILEKIQDIVGNDTDLKESFEKGDARFFDKLRDRRAELEEKVRTDFQNRFQTLQEQFLKGDFGAQGFAAPPQGGEGMMGGTQGEEGMPQVGGGQFGPPPEVIEKLKTLREKFGSGEFGPPPAGFIAPEGMGDEGQKDGGGFFNRFFRRGEGEQKSKKLPPEQCPSVSGCAFGTETDPVTGCMRCALAPDVTEEERAKFRPEQKESESESQGFPSFEEFQGKEGGFPGSFGEFPTIMPQDERSGPEGRFGPGEIPSSFGAPEGVLKRESGGEPSSGAQGPFFTVPLPTEKSVNPFFEQQPSGGGEFKFFATPRIESEQNQIRPESFAPVKPEAEGGGELFGAPQNFPSPSPAPSFPTEGLLAPPTGGEMHFPFMRKLFSFVF